MDKIYQILVENIYSETFTNIFIGISVYASYEIFKKVRSYFTTPDLKVDKSTNTNHEEKVDKSTNTTTDSTNTNHEEKVDKSTNTRTESTNPQTQTFSENQPSEIEPSNVEEINNHRRLTSIGFATHLLLVNQKSVSRPIDP